MNPVVHHVVSGQAFLSGTAVIVLGFVLLESDRRGARMVGRVAVGLLAWLASVPLPLECLLLALLGLVVVLAMRPFPRRVRVTTGITALWIGCAVVVGTRQFTPRIPTVDHRRLDVVGHSVTVGLDDQTTWLAIVAASHGIDVRDHSQVGATVRSAIDQAERIVAGPSVVLVEIGGNDVLGTISLGDFAEASWTRTTPAPTRSPLGGRRPTRALRRRVAGSNAPHRSARFKFRRR